MPSLNDNFQNMDINQEKNRSIYYSIFNLISIIIVIQIIIFSIKNIIQRLRKESKSKFFTEENYKNCSCKKCQKRFKSFIIREKRNKMNFNFFFQIFLTIILCYLLVLSIFKFKKNWNNMKKFDPFEILEIPKMRIIFKLNKHIKIYLWNII